MSESHIRKGITLASSGKVQTWELKAGSKGFVNKVAVLKKDGKKIDIEIDITPNQYKTWERVFLLIDFGDIDADPDTIACMDQSSLTTFTGKGFALVLTFLEHNNLSFCDKSGKLYKLTDVFSEEPALTSALEVVSQEKEGAA